MERLKHHAHTALRRSEKYFKTDMVYLAKGGFWVTAQFALSSLAGLLLFALLAHLLDAATFGIYRYVISLVGILGAFSLTAMTSAVTQAVSRGHERTLYSSIPLQLRWSLLSVLVGIIVSIYYLFNAHLILSAAVLIGIIGATIGAVFNTFIALYSGRKNFRALFLTTALITIVQYSALASAAFFTHNIIILIATFFISGMVMNIVLYFAVTRLSPPRGESDHPSLEFGKKMSFLNIIGLISNNIDSVIVFHYLGAADLAIYAIAMIIPEKLRGVSKLAMPLMLPKLTEKEDEASAHAAIKPKLRFAVALFGTVALFYILIAPILFKVIFPGYLNAVWYSQIFALSIFAGITIAPLTVFIAQKSLKNITSYSIIVPVIQTLIMLLGTIVFGLLGAVIARTLGLLFGSVYSFYLSRVTGRALPLASSSE